MAKVAFLVLAGTESREGLGRVVNAMIGTKEFKQAGDEVRLIFDGAATTWVGELAKPDHRPTASHHRPGQQRPDRQALGWILLLVGTWFLILEVFARTFAGLYPV